MSGPVEGLLLIDKPPGPTSHDVVAQVRARAGLRRVGHTGTLDPMASGLLVLALGRATRLIRYLPAAPKVYEGTLRLGVTTHSDDTTGTVLETHDGPLPDARRVTEVASEFVGRGEQVPPRVSARKISGQRMYRLARRGVEVEAATAPIEVFRFDLSPTERSDNWGFTASVSAGTYIRALARDLGARLGCGGALSSLRRTAIGPMSVADAVPADAEDLFERVVAVVRMPLEPPSLQVDGPAARRFAQGGEVTTDDTGHGDGLFRVLTDRGELLGVGEARAGRLRPRVVLRSR